MKHISSLFLSVNDSSALHFAGAGAVPACDSLSVIVLNHRAYKNNMSD